MKTESFHALVIFAALMFLSGAAVATNHTNDTEDVAPPPADSSLGDGVISSNFVLLGVAGPAADAIEKPSQEQESEGEVKIDKERDDNDNITINKSDAEQTARNVLSTPEQGEWMLEDSETEEDDGYFKFEFVLEGVNNTEGEAEVRVDGSTGEVFRHEEEIEREIEEEGEEAREALEGGAVSLKGHIAFRNGGYEVETEEEQEADSVTFTVRIESPEEDSMNTMAVDRKEIAESVEVESGTYDAAVKVVRDGEKIHSQSKQVTVRGTGEAEEESEEQQRQELMKKSKEELVKMILDLREEVEEGHEHSGEERDQEREERERRDLEEPEDETEESETEVEAEANGTEAEAEVEREGPGSNSNRPGFVGRMLGSVFGGR